MSDKLLGYAPDLAPIHQNDLDQRRELIEVNKKIALDASERAKRAAWPLSKTLFTKAALIAQVRVEQLEDEINQLNNWIVEWTN